MMRYFFVLLISGLALPACAAYAPQPLNLNHPAHAEAPSALRPTPSQTLAYTQLDIPSPRPVVAQEPGGQTVTAEGKVIAIVASGAQLIVEHGEIKGFMDAMTMGYRVEPPLLMDSVKSGDKVRFTIDVAKKAIIKLDKIN